MKTVSLSFNVGPGLEEGNRINSAQGEASRREWRGCLRGNSVTSAIAFINWDW